MPYSKDIRCGEGWFNTNINCFYDYLDGMDEELVIDGDGVSQVEEEYRATQLEEEIEQRVNEFIRYKVFGEKRRKLDEDDSLPEEYEDVWDYVYSHILLLVKRKPTWYVLRSTLAEEEAELKAELDAVEEALKYAVACAERRRMEALYQQNRKVIVEKMEAVKEERAAAVQAARTGGRAVRASLFRQCKK